LTVSRVWENQDTVTRHIKTNIHKLLQPFMPEVPHQYCGYGKKEFWPEMGRMIDQPHRERNGAY
jgi:hypothetical protein